MSGSAEEYELPRTSFGHHRRQPSGGVSSRKRFTLHTGPPTGEDLQQQNVNGDPGPSTLRNRSSHVTLDPISPGAKPQIMRQTDLFLTEDPTTSPFPPRGRDEVVDIPDFGGMLGLTTGEGQEDNYVRAQGFRSPWKRRLFLLMEEPGSSGEAFVVHVVCTGSIVASALLTMLSTLPSFHTDPAASKVLFGLDTTIVVLFTIEYIARLLAHSDSWRMCWNWAHSFFAIVDLLAVLPYYIEVALQEDTTILFRFSILRTLRLLRVFRAFKYQNQMLFTIEVMYIAIHRSKDALLALAFFICMALVVFSTLIYFAERGVWDVTLGTFVDAEGNPSQFESIPSAAWFVLVTITTVGYGELIPRSILGRLFTVPLLVFGLLLIALPSFVLGRNFAIVFDAMSNQIMQPIDAAAAAHSARVSYDQSRSNGPIQNSQPQNAQYRSTSPFPRTTDSPPPNVRLADRGNMVGGLQYDALPLSDLSAGPSGSAGAAGSGGGGLNSSGSQQSGFSLTQLEAGKTHPMFPPGEAWQGKGLAGASLDTGAAGGATGPAALSGLGKNDLTNLKLASNQQILLLEIERLREITEQQGSMMEKMMEMLGRMITEKESKEDTEG